MSGGTIAIVLVAAAAHAVWNAVSKYKRGDTLLFVWAYTCCSALLCVPFGIALIATGDQPFGWVLVVGAFGSAVLHIVYSLTLQTGYDRAELGVVYPVARGTGPMLSMLFAIILFGERPGAAALAGSIAVVAGIVVVAGNPFRGTQRHPFRGIAWGGATGASIAAYTLWDGYSMSVLGQAPVAYYAGTLLFQTVMLTPLVLRRRREIPTAFRTNRAPIVTVAVFSPLAYILVLMAMQTAPVSLVAPLRESSIVIGSLLAWRLFHESHLARRTAGAAIVLSGIAAIAF